jgi:hypothetical protein
MNSRELIDAQFDRAVEIVQNLPKTGPVQTGYEEKLAMYRCVATFSTISISIPSTYMCISLYKQGKPTIPQEYQFVANPSLS